MSSLAVAGHEHHERLNAQVDLIPGLADALAQRPLSDDVAPRFVALQDFIAGTLRAHMRAIETDVYPELDRLMRQRHSMAQMRGEHRDLDALFAALETYRGPVVEGTLDSTAASGLRRVLYRLYALLKVHLAEEAEYLSVLERNLGEAEQVALVHLIEASEARAL